MTKKIKKIDKVGIPLLFWAAAFFGWGIYSGQPDQTKSVIEKSVEHVRQEPDVVFPTFSKVKDTGVSHKKILGLEYLAEYDLRLVKEPVVNSSGDYMTVIRTKESDFAKSLGALVRTETQEEIWMYLPQKGLAIEIGAKSVVLPHSGITAKPQLGVIPDQDLIKKIMENEPIIIEYHFHPSPDPSQYVVYSVPSENDVDMAVYGALLHASLRRGQKRRPRTESKVVSRFGVTSYGLGNAGVSKYLDIFGSMGEEKAFAEFYADMMINSNQNFSSAQETPFHVRQIENLLNMRRGKHFHVKFQPFDVE